MLQIWIAYMNLNILKFASLRSQRVLYVHPVTCIMLIDISFNCVYPYTSTYNIIAIGAVPVFSLVHEAQSMI